MVLREITSALYYLAFSARLRTSVAEGSDFLRGKVYYRQVITDSYSGRTCNRHIILAL